MVGDVDYSRPVLPWHDVKVDIHTGEIFEMWCKATQVSEPPENQPKNGLTIGPAFTFEWIAVPLGMSPEEFDKGSAQ